MSCFVNPISQSYYPQRTLTAPTTMTGVGLHSGKEAILTLSPAPIGAGIVFIRTDLNDARIPMSADAIQDTMMSSNLVVGEARVGTVEHLLSAVASCGIDNLYIEVNSPEIPIMDGSALPFLEMIKEVGIAEQSAAKAFLKILKPIKVTDGDKWAEFLPNDKGFLMNFGIDFNHPAIKATPQYVTFELSTANFEKEIASARTFGFLSDLERLKQYNLAQGANMSNAIVMDDTSIINGDLRYPDEFVRHKILDAVGDLFVVGYNIIGQFNAYKSGHALNNTLIRAVLADKTAYKIVTSYDKTACPISFISAKIP